MTERIRFHLDENVSPDVGRALRRHGVDVTTTVEAGLRSAGDLEQLSYAIDSVRVVVTHDADFLRMASQGQEHAGIAYCHKATRPLGDIIRGLILIYEVLTPAEMRNRVEYL